MTHTIDILKQSLEQASLHEEESRIRYELARSQRQWIEKELHYYMSDAEKIHLEEEKARR